LTLGGRQDFLLQCVIAMMVWRDTCLGLVVMRVAFVVERFPMLSETFVVAQAAALIRQGCSVDIFATRMEAAGLSHDAVVSERLIDRTRFASNSLAYRLADRLGSPYRVCERLRRHAVVANLRDKQSYDVILCHFGPNGANAVAAVTKGQLKGPVWTVFHGYDLSVGEGARSLRYTALFKHGAKFLPISDYWATQLVDSGCPPERIAVQRMGVACEDIVFSERPAANGRIRFLTVSRLIEKKGIEFGLRALAQMARKLPGLDWDYIVIGTGPLRDGLEALARQLGIADRIHFMGGQPHAEVKRQLGLAHIFLLPSVVAADGDMEGIPVAIMEAMAAGLTVASTRHSGIPELVDDGISGLLAAERDVAALAGNLARLATDEGLRLSLARAARLKVETDFNDRLLTRNLFDMIAQEAASPSRPDRCAA